MTDPAGPATNTRLPRILAAAYALLVLYACLHPMSGWQDSGLPVFDYLVAPWPRYYRVEDLVLNVLGYVPLGFLLVPALGWRAWPWLSLATATLVAGLLSLSIETTQHFLPSRVASNLDLGCNLLGAALGAFAGLFWGHRLFHEHGGLVGLRTRLIIPGRSGDLGLVLLGLWLLAQLMPESPLFGSGDIREALGLVTPLSFDAGRFIQLEAVQVACSLVAIALFARCIMLDPALWPVVGLIALALLAKTLATASFLVPGSPTAWLTPGSGAGLVAGLLLLLATLRLPRIQQHALAGITLLIATTVGNLIPDNPYLALDLQFETRGNFLNFHGLTQVTAAAWPFVALGYLSALGLWRGAHLSER